MNPYVIACIMMFWFTASTVYSQGADMGIGFVPGGGHNVADSDMIKKKPEKNSTITKIAGYFAYLSTGPSSCFGPAVVISTAGFIVGNNTEISISTGTGTEPGDLDDVSSPDDSLLQELYRRGVGYLELIRLILISDKSGNTFREILNLRIRKEKLSTIAQKYNVDYRDIYIESYKIKSKIDNPD
jgi:hypothetical protein